MKILKICSLAIILAFSFNLHSQTNVFDNIIVPSDDHTHLETAILQEGLETVLRDNSANLTVFAPTDAAFDALAAALGTDINGLLALPNLADILRYHVLGTNVPSTAVVNGAIVQPLSLTNTLKLTVTSLGDVFVNQAAVTAFDIAADNGIVHVLGAVVLPDETVVDIAIDNDFNTLTEAVVIAELLPALTNPLAELTVFAPTDAAFDALAAALGTDKNGLLALPNLADILLYHVMGSEVPSSAVTNGLIAQPLSGTNTLKLTVTSSGDVFVNQAAVTAFDIAADNGIVHILGAVVLPGETVVDIAIDNDFNTLTTAVITAELLPALTNPLAALTVFAPTDAAFDALAAALGTDINGLLALPNLADILLYHVIGSEVPSSAVTNGLIAQPLSVTNTLKLTVTGSGDVFVNQAEVTAFDIAADNGIVHVLVGVVLPVETVVDIAIDNNFTTLTAAVAIAELLPALTNPLVELTVFAPTDAAFDALATALGTDIEGILALSNLADILLYHVVSGRLLSTDLTNGDLQTLNGESVMVDLTSGVMIDESNVTTPDLQVSNGVVHVMDGVLLPAAASIEEVQSLDFSVYPNPASDLITIDSKGNSFEEIIIYDMNGKIILQTSLKNSTMIDISAVKTGSYIIELRGEKLISAQKLDIL